MLPSVPVDQLSQYKEVLVPTLNTAWIGELDGLDGSTTKPHCLPIAHTWLMGWNRAGEVVPSRVQLVLRVVQCKRGGWLVDWLSRVAMGLEIGFLICRSGSQLPTSGNGYTIYLDRGFRGPLGAGNQ